MHRDIEETTISAAEWTAVLLPLLESGHKLKIEPQGRSMAPFLLGGRDEVILGPVNGRKLKRRDIVLYPVEGGIHVLHRIHHINASGVYTLGDAHTVIEGPYSPESMLAVADAIIRKGKTVSCSGRGYNLLAETWLRMRPFRGFAFWVLQRTRFKRYKGS